MHGFTESFNISVSAAICLFSITDRLRKSDTKWHISYKEKMEIKLQWLKNSVKDAGHLEVHFKKKFNLLK
jgi:tRNA (guanosine-2'-O-)-methyltransferase